MESSGIFLRCNGYLGEPLVVQNGVKSPFQLPGQSRDCSRVAALELGLI